MRRTFLLLVFLMIGILCYSQDLTKSKIYLNVENKIKTGDIFIPNSLYQIQNSSDDLSSDEKNEIYLKYLKTSGNKIGGYFLDSIIIPFPGFGSYIIGDITGGTITLSGMIGGGVIMLISAGIMNNPSTSSYAGPSILMGVGFGIAFVSYLQSLVTPFIFCDSYNKQLAVALKLRQEDINHLGIKMDTVVPLIGNILLGYGVGSFAQGDTFGGVTGIAGELSGIICFAAGIFSIGYPTSLLATNPTNRQEILSQVQGSTAAMIIGASVYGLTKIFEIIRPFWFAADYDKNLVMSKPGELHFAFDPYVVPAMTGDKVEMRFGLNLSAGI